MQQKQISFCLELHTRNKNEAFLPSKHFHKHHELYFLLSGETKYFVNDEILYIHEGETAFVKSEYIHKTAYETDNDSKRILISFSSEFLGEDYLHYINDLGHKKLFARSEDVHRLFTALYDEYTLEAPYYKQQCKNLLRQLIITLLRTDTPIETKTLSENETIIQQATKYIQENLSEEITLKKLAETYAMSESHFSRTFKQYTGVGVSKYIKLTRLRQSEKLLNENKYSVTAVALKCGFSNSNYFISEFKKHKGITPLKYIAINKKGK